MSKEVANATSRNSTTFFRNTSCVFFPCHEGIPEAAFNCLFCYCPLYTLGPTCGGDFSYTSTDIKDCSRCTRLHDGDQGAAIVKAQFSRLAELARAKTEDKE